MPLKTKPSEPTPANVEVTPLRRSARLSDSEPTQQPVEDPERILREHRAAQRAEASRIRPDPVDVEINVHAERKRASESTPNVSPDYPSGFIRAPLKYLRTVSEDDSGDALMSDEETKEDIRDDIAFETRDDMRNDSAIETKEEEAASDVSQEVIDLTNDSDEDEIGTKNPRDDERKSSSESADEHRSREDFSVEKMREQIRAEVMVEKINQFEEAIEMARRARYEDELRSSDEIQRLRVEIEKLKDSMSAGSSENAQLKDLVSRKDDEIKRLEAENRTLRVETDKLVFASQKPCSRCSALEEALNRSILDSENLRSTVDSLQSGRSDQVCEECLKKLAEIEQLRRDTTDMMEQAKSSLKQREETHQGEVDQLESEIEFYRNQFEKLAESSDERENKLLAELFDLRRLSATECSICPTLRDEIQMLGQKVTKLGLEKSQEAQSSEMAKQR
ncbi:unnamed protein product, partial [Aphanomyces euteiches]